jgi:hypothetical protein
MKETMDRDIVDFEIRKAESLRGYVFTPVSRAAKVLVKERKGVVMSYFVDDLDNEVDALCSMSGIPITIQEKENYTQRTRTNEEKKQFELYKKILEHNINIVTCGNCGAVILIDMHKKKETMKCYQCGARMDNCDCPDLWS